MHCLLFNLFVDRIAFIEFGSMEAAEAAKNKMTGKAVDGRQVFIDFAEDRGSGGV